MPVSTTFFFITLLFLPLSLPMLYRKISQDNASGMPFQTLLQKELKMPPAARR